MDYSKLSNEELLILKKEKEKEFEEVSYSRFIEYGIQDVILLWELDDKLKLLDLAKFISYTCGVNLNNIHGTLLQWNSFMYNRCKDENLILPLESSYPKNDDTLLRHSLTLPESSRSPLYNRLLADPELHGQKFVGGWTRGTAKFWKWVFSLDYTSLYPSAIMWANIGIDTLIEPCDLPKELLDLRAKYFIYYPKDIDAKEISKYDYKFIEKVLRKPEVVEEIRALLLKYNVSATPNGMFFKKEKRAISSQIMEDMIKQRKTYKKEMKKIQQQMEDLKTQETYSKDDFNALSAKADKADVYQMGIKILINSYYGSLSLQANVSAGQSEYFSTAVTSVGRIANILIGQEQTINLLKMVGEEPTEVINGVKTNLDCIAQADTDSIYLSIEKLVKKKFGDDYANNPEATDKRLIEFSLNYIEKIAMPLVRDKLDNNYAYALNAHMPEKLQEDPEVICDNFISIAPKMYFTRKFWDEGVTLAKPKLKVTGLSMVRSTTPKFYRQELQKAMDILIDGDIPKVIEYCNKVQLETADQAPSDICINQGVSSLDYTWDEKIKKFRRWTGEKYLSAPVNSRASLIHNKYIHDNGITIKDIEPGDKISFLYMKVPNITGSDAFAFQNEDVFNNGLKEYIDTKTMFEKGFMKPIKLITGPLKWDLTPKDEQISDDEW